MCRTSLFLRPKGSASSCRDDDDDAADEDVDISVYSHKVAPVNDLYRAAGAGATRPASSKMAMSGPAAGPTVPGLRAPGGSALLAI